MSIQISRQPKHGFLSETPNARIMTMKTALTSPPVGSNGVDSATEQTGQLLAALHSLRDGDFSARLPSDWTGVVGKIADAFNDIAKANDRMASELERVGRV